MPTSAVPKIFISYAREDLDRAVSVYKHLQGRGLHPFMDKYDLVGGERWETALMQRHLPSPGPP
jgi:hypothetical protein